MSSNPLGYLREIISSSYFEGPKALNIESVVDEQQQNWFKSEFSVNLDDFDMQMSWG